MDDPDAYARAKKRVRQIRGFYIHATVYALVNTFLIALNMLTSRAGLWSIWPLLGWGIGLAAHAVAVFGFGGLWGPAWEQQKIKELMDKRASP